jgi:hypothetical protein
MELLLITTGNLKIGYSIAAFLLLLGICIFFLAVKTAHCYEHEEDPVGDHEPVTYDQIIHNERLCGEFINN